jgi:hypothetical protein
VLSQRFSLLQALIAEMRLDALLPLAADTSVLRIDPLLGNRAPAGCAPPTQAHVECGKWILGMTADTYRTRYGSGRIALLDTGVWPGHCLFRTDPCANHANSVNNSGTNGTQGPPGPITASLDCIPNDCLPDSRTDPDVHSVGHGTASAAILAGTDAMGPVAGTVWEPLRRSPPSSMR